MTKLNQIIAVRKGVLGEAERAFTDAYHAIQKSPLLSGISKTYQAKDEDGDQLGSEKQLVQVKVADILTGIQDSLVRMIDVHATLDTTNQIAVAPIIVAGQRLTEPLPVATLLTLEKKLTDLATFVKKLPVLDPAELWTADPTIDGVYRSEPVRTQRQKKVPRNHVKARATDKHPEQVEVYYEDVVVGYWTTVKFSGATPYQAVKDLAGRIATLQAAVKQAREQANMVEVVEANPGAAIIGYLFG